MNYHPLSAHADLLECKDRRDFYVSFELPPGLTHLARPIERVIASIDTGAENLNLAPTESGYLHHRSNRLILWLYNDIQGCMMRAIRELQAEQPKFSMRVSYLDEPGIKELESFVYTGCRLECLQHSLLSYEGSDEQVRLTAAEPFGPTKVELQGTITNSNNRLAVMKLLQISFYNVVHNINAPE